MGADLDGWIAKVRSCEYLPENDLKQLCQMVRSTHHSCYATIPALSEKEQERNWREHRICCGRRPWFAPYSPLSLAVDTATVSACVHVTGRGTRDECSG